MPRTTPFANLAAEARADPARQARIEACKRAMKDAIAIEVVRASAANVSRIEREEDVYLSTLRRYVAALGGELEINAVSPDRTVSLVAPRR